ncbi:hypothetical protein FA13DRAFT_1795347 [Coprinellus micaceus]|uniref:Uncharacterized protein n=1 Tax=Coprinellus micaceus TaxID=71717 RepID=A0A4Y7SYG9_COPMI|nr:hypothetical protein FA13DRAFT_1795347 [Coprinellus micaceus]
MPKLWPGYMYFGNESKHRRGRASLKLFEEVAYFLTLPDAFSDWYIRLSGKGSVPKTLAAHLRREIFHAQWNILLDDEFIHAYRHGLIVDCPDKVRRRFYPRILAYAADYPERARVTGIRTKGDYLCPRCTIPVDIIQNLGTPLDRQIRVERRRVDNDSQKEKVHSARNFIYKQNYAIDYQGVEALLKPNSLVPSTNAFSDRLSAHGLDLFSLIVADPLHEVEIGVWKDLFAHLLRLLDTIDKPSINIVNSRHIPPDAHLAARNYEDMLQCAGPVFEGLFPEDHDLRVQNLLFSLAHWHALAKLRMHTDCSLSILEDWTTTLGEDARNFLQLTCTKFSTQESNREYEARKRREARKKSTKRKTSVSVKSPGQAGHERPPPTLTTTEPPCGSAPVDAGVTTSNFPTDGRQERTWSISTTKFHALGDVVSSIRRCGTTDSYSTQLSERFHRFSKSRYHRTNKKNVLPQLSALQTRQARLRKIQKQVEPSEAELSGPLSLPEDNSGHPFYFIGKSQNQPLNLGHLLATNANDLAFKSFLPKLKRHLFPRVLEMLLQEAEAEPETFEATLPTLKALSTSFTENDLQNLIFHSDRIYRHAIFKLRYTTYDCRSDSDTLNPSTSRRDFMCVRGGTDPKSADGYRSQYVYGRLLGVFHANVIYAGPGASDLRRRRFDFLWVRWFTPTADELPWSAKRLDTLTLAPIEHPDSCGFLDPATVLRAAHILPWFSEGLLYPDEDDNSNVAGGDTRESRQKRMFSKSARDRWDWRTYYVNRFVDRDMAMRFHTGLAPGHAPETPLPPWNTVQSDQEPMDVDATTTPPGSQGSWDVPMEDTRGSSPSSSEDSDSGISSSKGGSSSEIPEADSSDGDYSDVF